MWAIRMLFLITCIYKHAFGMDYANNEYNMRHDHIIYMVPTDQLTDIETDPCPPD